MVCGCVCDGGWLCVCDGGGCVCWWVAVCVLVGGCVCDGGWLCVYV